LAIYIKKCFKKQVEILKILYNYSWL